MPSDERLLHVDDIVDTTIGMEGGLGVIEDDDRAVCASTSKLALAGQGGRETDGVVEGETEGLVHLLTALATVKQVCLDVVADGKQLAAGCVRRDVPVGAGDTAGEGTWRACL